MQPEPALIVGPSSERPRRRSGSSTPRATWLGPRIDTGPRAGNEVALTFDDGPSDPCTLHVRDILDAHDVKGTFFSVGKAIAARPDIARALLDHGHLLGNHSYEHRRGDAFVPAYPELAKANEAFHNHLGIRPAFFRPPYGAQTPFMSRVAARQGMRLVTWDVMAWDWATADSDKIAKRVLDRVKGGSIVLLHDGQDGEPTADRSATVAALPKILAGFADRGLKAVRLDRLLGGPAYL